MEDITDAHFEMKHLGKYHDLYVQSNAFIIS